MSNIESNNEFVRTKVGDMEVFMMKSNGYMNATELCENTGKELKKWSDNSNSIELINRLSLSVGLPKNELIIKFEGNQGMNVSYNGTYIHPKLIVHVAIWCSPGYALMVSDSIIKFHAREAIEEKGYLFEDR